MHRAHRDLRAVHAGQRGRRVLGAGGAADLRARRHRVRARRSRGRSGRGAAELHPHRRVRRDAPAAAQHACPVALGRRRAQAAGPRRRRTAGTGLVAGQPRSAVDAGPRAARHHHAARGCSDPLRDLGGCELGVVLDRRRAGDGQLVHLRVELLDLVPDHDLRPVAAAGGLLRGAGCVRGVLPGARAARATRPARAAGGTAVELAARGRDRRDGRRADLAQRGSALPGGGIMIIQTEDLRRDYLVGTRLRRRRVTAVADVTLTVAPGEAVGFLGPNGAGKSTTIKMLTGVLVPTAGRATVCGLDPVRERRELARRIGVVFGQRSQLWWDLPLAESFDLLAAIHRVPPARYRERLDECVELLDMAGVLTTPVRQLSLGQRMRGEVTAALLHSPSLLVLDEPTVGLDLISKERLRVFLAAV